MAQHHKPSSSSSSTTAAYDYAGALTSLSERIAALSAAKQQASVPATRLGEYSRARGLFDEQQRRGWGHLVRSHGCCTLRTHSLVARARARSTGPPHTQVPRCRLCVQTSRAGCCC
jgi:hypothetical protein